MEAYIEICVCAHMSKLKIHLLYDHLFIYYMLYHTVIHCLRLVSPSFALASSLLIPGLLIS